jgi:hypothetical protein
VAATVKDAWQPYIKGFFKQAEDIKEDIVLVAIDPNFMSKALDQRSRYFIDKSIEIMFPEHTVSLLKSGRYKRACVFNLTRIIREIDRSEQKITEEEGT